MSSYEDFVTLVENNRAIRHWSRAELARRAGITQPEISRALGGGRMPTLRHVRGLAEAFSGAPIGGDEPEGYANWLAKLVELAEAARTDARTDARTRPAP
jgi:transcriptional regulator with XRE-family HTH domain